ncbi:MAG: hypothetical protein ACKO3M_08190 [Rubrivivax sp.]
MASPGKKSFLLRVDPHLWEEIERLAAQELRSANAQVEYLLREALARRGRAVAAGRAEPAQARPRAHGSLDLKRPSEAAGADTE